MVDQSTPSSLAARDAAFGYGDKTVVDRLDLAIPARSLTVIVGANASGKSTALRGLARLLKPQRGTVVLDGRSIADLPTRDVARRLGLLPQMPISPDGIRVADLVARGRHPHQSLLRQWTSSDERAVVRAMDATDVANLSHRRMDELSGGQRQRVWLAMVLAQETEFLLLDEPTSFLDIAHQIELMELLAVLNSNEGRTIVAVLHDLNQACRYATHLVAMCEGRIVAKGAPREIVTADLVERVFGLSCVILEDPISHSPLIVPGTPSARVEARARGRR
ncbi:ABC transporter ATP-binding protein [Amorphus sp. 3PC139-8]|uniref:ABC transporter ATP-binding protein n=1 Tax=Amorphus sp. 3PC139-8 TaxID=2735676 RepID=UPI00345DB73E